MKDYIYVDYNACGIILPEVKDTVNKMMNMPLNPSSIHYLGQKASAFIEDTRDSMKEYFNCTKSHDVLFVSSGSEANNMAINHSRFEDDEFDLWICTMGEHKSVIDPITKKKNHYLISIDKNGLLNQGELFDLLKSNLEKKVFLSIIYANNESGVINDLEGIIKEIRKIHDKVIIHSDFGQVIGKIDYRKFSIDIQNLDLDLATIIGYKFGALTGAAALIYKRNLKLLPMIYGGSQESNLRAGTENVLAIYSMKIALDNQRYFDKVKKLRDDFEDGLKKIISNEDLIIFSENAPRTNNTSYFAIRGLLSKTQLIYFNQYKIYLGSGSACSAGLDEDSYLLSSMGFDGSIRKSAIRASFGWNSDYKDIEQILLRISELYEKLN